MLKFTEINLNKLLQKLPVQKIVIVGLLVALLLSIKQCRLKELALNSKGLEIQMYQNKNQAFESEINDKNQQINTQKINLVERDKEMEKALLENSKLKKLYSQIKFQNQSNINNTFAEFLHDTISRIVEVPSSSDTSAIHTLDLSDKFVPIGTHFKKTDPQGWFSYQGSIHKTGILMDSINVKNSFTVNVGEKKVKGIKGFFGKTEPVVELINENPYTKTTNMYNIQFKPKPKKFYETKIFYLGVGVVGGLLLPVIMK